MSTKIKNNVKNSVLTIPELDITLNYGQSVTRYGGSNYLITIKANQGYTFNGGTAPINYLKSVTGSNSSEKLTKVSDTEYNTRVDFSYYQEAFFSGEAITDESQVAYVNVTSNVTNCTVVSDVSEILAGTEVTINLNAADGYGFKVAPKITEGSTEINFTVSEDKLTASITFTANSDFTITASAVKFVKWDIAEVKNSTVDGINNVLVGDTVNITITPNSGYVFDSVPYINRYGTLNYFTVGTDNIARLENIKLSSDDENISVVAKTKVSEDVTPTTKTGFLRIYTPTDEQLDLLADYGGINPSTQDTLNMTNYIYGLYKVFVPITPDGEADIYLARNDTKVKSNYVNSENIEIESDEIEIPIKFNNVFDFSPYTKANIYLPFIGNVNFDTDILRAGKLKIKYNANLLNLNKLATILVDGKEIDYHTGKCGFNIPFNLSSYAYNVNNLSSNNYLTDLTPKVILINSIPYDNGNDFIGRDIHKYLDNAETLKGFNSCEVIKFAENSFITESEKDEIINLLRTGIYF